MPDTFISWRYWECCRCSRNVIPEEEDTCPRPSCREKRCGLDQIKTLRIPEELDCCNSNTYIPCKRFEMMLTLIASLRSFFTQSFVPPRLLWWYCCKCNKISLEGEHICADCKEKRCEECRTDSLTIAGSTDFGNLTFCEGSDIVLTVPDQARSYSEVPAYPRAPNRHQY